MWLPFGISSAPAHFQEIVDQLTSDLKGVVVYVDDVLVSGASAAEHLDNLCALLQCLQDKEGLCCRKEKCLFAQASIEYLGYTLSSNGIAKGSKVDAVQLMPAPSHISSLRSFPGSVHLADVAESLYRLTKKEVQWSWCLQEAQGHADR